MTRRNRPFAEVYDKKRVWYLVCVAIGALLLWDTPFLYPLRLLVVFFHELSHAIAVFATGGTVNSIELNSAEGGACHFDGGWAVVAGSAGYLGSMLCGGACLWYASRARRLRAGVAFLGLVLLGTTIVFVRPMPSFGAVFGLATGAGLVALAWRAGREWNEFALLTIGVTSCLYAIWDIKEDVLMGDGLSDAAILSGLTGVPTLLWGFAWIALACAGAYWFGRLACRKRTR